jgi:hypothetical protein
VDTGPSGNAKTRIAEKWRSDDRGGFTNIPERNNGKLLFTLPPMTLRRTRPPMFPTRTMLEAENSRRVDTHDVPDRAHCLQSASTAHQTIS